VAYGGAWVWRHRLFVWEEDLLLDCCSLLANVVLQDNILDWWSWRFDYKECYFVKGAYHLLNQEIELVVHSKLG
jgi:hypothetical protein